VPEIVTAALCASSLLLTRRADPHAMLLSAVLLLPATLSRYEAWPVAVFLLLSLAVPGGHDGSGQRPARQIGARVKAAVITAAGPLSWIAWNAYAHGDPLHFHARVSAYWFAWGGGTAGPASAWWLYPKTVILDAPILAASLAGGVVWIRRRAHLRTWLRPALGALGVVAALTFAQGIGGAPTHHPERTLLLVWAVGWIAAADWLAGRHAPNGTGWDRWRHLWVTATLLFLVTRTHSVSSWYGVRRGEEVRLGTWLRQHTEGPLLLAPEDYGYFAIMAAMGAPERVRLGGSVDPPDKDARSAFSTVAGLRSRVGREGARWLVASGEAAGVAERLGRERMMSGRYRVFQQMSGQGKRE